MTSAPALNTKSFQDSNKQVKPSPIASQEGLQAKRAPTTRPIATKRFIKNSIHEILQVGKGCKRSARPLKLHQ